MYKMLITFNRIKLKLILRFICLNIVHLELQKCLIKNIKFD